MKNKNTLFGQIQYIFNKTILSSFYCSIHNENFSSSRKKEKKTTHNRQNWLLDNPT